MHIITFKYNREAAALISQPNLSREETTQLRQRTATRRLANHYTDRYLWEEAAAARHDNHATEFIIPGNWQ